MKKLLITFFNIMLILCITPALFAQTTEEEKETKETQTLEEGLNEAVNKLEGLFQKKPKKQQADQPEEVEEEIEIEEPDLTEEEEQAAQEVINSVFGSEEDQEDYVPMQNSFTGSFTMTYEGFKNGKPDKHNPGIIKFTFDKSNTAMQMDSKEDASVRILMDLEENTMTTISTDKGKSTGFKMRRPNMKKMTEEVMKDIVVTRTKETRTIDGYRCEKVIYEDTSDDYVTTAWVTNDIDVDWREVMKSMAMGRLPGNHESQKMVEGFAIESETVGKGGKERYTMKTSDINIGKINRDVFDTSGVEIISMPGFGG